jgi:nickel superoxide dismutase
MYSRKTLTVTVAVILFVATSPSFIQAHCQLPCGIYDDQMRFEMLNENITTIEKSMKEIQRLETSKPVNYNQIVRWVNNKDRHADDMIRVLTDYFLAQRIKPIDDEKSDEYRLYAEKLTLVHRLIFYTMKSKRLTDLKVIDSLRTLLNEFQDLYFDQSDPADHQH